MQAIAIAFSGSVLSQPPYSREEKVVNNPLLLIAFANSRDQTLAAWVASKRAIHHTVAYCDWFVGSSLCISFHKGGKSELDRIGEIC